MGRAAMLSLVLLASSGCLRGFEAEGPFRCSADGTCPGGRTCDAQLCCDPDSAQGCPTVPSRRNLCGRLSGTPGDSARLLFQDLDGDGDGNERVSRYLCGATPSGWATGSRDCDDQDPAINSLALEQCNGRDDDCDGELDEGLTPRTPWFRDEDGDGFGSAAAQARVDACAAPPGTVAQGGDCDDLEPGRFPGAAELCNGLDDDCDGQPDAPGPRYADVDDGSGTLRPCTSDALGNCQQGALACRAGPAGGVVRACVPNLSPEPRDRCDGLDDDCDGLVDEAPDCGGPPSGGPGRGLLSDDGTLSRGVRAGALLSLEVQGSQCLKQVLSSAPGWNDDLETWASTTGTFQLWYAEVPAPLPPWDLSREGLKLRLKLSVLPGSETAFGTMSFGHPVVYLCGEQPTDFIRYVARLPVALSDGATSFDRVFNLGSPGPDYVMGRGSGFDTTRVRRVEVLIARQGPFTIRLEPETGFVK